MTVSESIRACAVVTLMTLACTVSALEKEPEPEKVEVGDIAADVALQAPARSAAIAGGAR